MKKINWRIILSVTALSVIGLLSLLSVAPPYEFSSDAFYKQLFLKQFFILGLSILIMVALMLPSYISLRRYCYLFYIVILLFLVILIIFVPARKDVTRWIQVGPVSLQPSEFMKLAVVLVLARFMMYQKNIATIKGLVGPFFLTAIPMVLVLVQPDLGSAFVFFPLLIAMVFTAGARTRHLITILLLCMLSLPIVYKFILKDYQQARIDSFIYPSKTPKDKSYHREQSIKVVASGGLIGTTLSESALADPYLVPIRHSDFIFTVIGEKTGFLGSTLVLMLFTVFFYQSLKIAYNTREPFGKLTVIGMTTFLAIQAIINIGMTIGIMPITGITLPFISQGGSSLVTNFAAVGLILNIGMRHVPTFAKRDFGYDDVEIRDVTDRFDIR